MFNTTFTIIIIKLMKKKSRS